MRTRHGSSVGLVGLLLATAAFAEAPAASQATDEEVNVAVSSPEDRIMEEIVVTARRPGTEPKSVAFTMHELLESLRETPIEAPELDGARPIKPEIRLTL